MEGCRNIIASSKEYVKKLGYLYKWRIWCWKNSFD